MAGGVGKNVGTFSRDHMGGGVISPVMRMTHDPKRDPNYLFTSFKLFFFFEPRLKPNYFLTAFQNQTNRVCKRNPLEPFT